MSTGWQPVRGDDHAPVSGAALDDLSLGGAERMDEPRFVQVAALQQENERRLLWRAWSEGGAEQRAMGVHPVGISCTVRMGPDCEVVGYVGGWNVKKVGLAGEGRGGQARLVGAGEERLPVFRRWRTCRVRA